MKKFRKLTALMLAVVMALAMSITAFAQEVKVSNDGPAKITIKNAAKGEDYTIYKLFDATVNKDNNNIAYQGDIPAELTSFFKKDDVGNVIPKDSILDNDGKTEMTDDLKDALEAWASNATPIATGISDGSTLEFTGLPYGYYVMTTSNEDGNLTKSVITVTSTQPDASIYDKNVNEPSAKKEAGKESYSIGDTITYTATFDTTNYMGEGEDAKQVVNYEISDTLPEYLSNVKVTSIMIGNQSHTVKNEKDEDVTPQFTDKKIVIPWAAKNEDGTYTSKYDQGVQIVVTYTAELTSTTNINDADTNTITIRPYVDNGTGTEGGDPWNDSWEDSAEITTYAAAIKKVDENGDPLDGATFTITGLEVEEVETGVYRVISYDRNSTTESAELSTDDQGKLYIVGLAEDVSLTVTELKAPDGYNKLTETKELTPQVLNKTIYETSGNRYYDKDGNLVSASSEAVTTTPVQKNLSDLDTDALKIVNKQGTLLPSTGGIGTTIFYVIGAILVIGAGVILVAKKRMSNE